jgi:heme O synthase-like polyprenyltransferase
MSLTISEFFKLTKPGVLYLLMITAGASMILATNFNLDIIKALTGFLRNSLLLQDLQLQLIKF